MKCKNISLMHLILMFQLLQYHIPFIDLPFLIQFFLKLAAEHNDQLCATWIEEWGDIKMEDAVWLGGSGVDDHTN